jgi:hypothetical protein
MTRRCLLLFGMLVGLLALGAGGLLCQRSAINRSNAERIKDGMTRTEVEALLGGPARVEGGSYPLCMCGPPPTEWATPSLLVCIWFDANDRVCLCRLHHDESPLDMFRRWLRL